MKNELLDAAKEFKADFLDKYPNVENPVKLIADFNHSLNEYAEQSNESTTTITSINELLVNSSLEAFAAADFKKGKLQDQLREKYEQEEDHRGDDEALNEIADTANQEATEIEEKSKEVVNGDSEADLAGLKELVDELITGLE